ncbi:MAG: hypothetical protein WCP26_04475 [Actinomycetes bacterium]
MATATPKKTATSKTTAKKTAPKKTAPKKTATSKTTAKKAAPKKTATTRKPVASKTSGARKVTGNRTFAVAPAVVAAAPSFLASLVEDLGKFDLRELNLPAVEIPGFDVQKAVAEFDMHKVFADVVALPAKASGMVTEFATDVATDLAKRGSEAYSSVNHSVTLVREAVGV